MSEMLIDHPVVVIETLLKLKIGDEGRLLYLRKAITNGQIIYDSDKEFLKKMQTKLDLINSKKNITSDNSNNESVFNHDVKNKVFENNSKLITSKKELVKKEELASSKILELEIATIQNSISDLKNKDSKIKDNLELLLINREIITQYEIDKANSFGSFSDLAKTKDSDLFSLIKDNPVSKKISNFFKR
jgi:hypothetical protein